jgi:23S rRNA pseudouridine2457 synthase
MPYLRAFMSEYKYYIIYKPCPMLSQFIGTDQRCLVHLDYDFPEGIHAIGRLDNLSEGLLILTTNKKVTRLLFKAKEPHKRTYLVRVKGNVSAERLEQLRTGVTFKIAEGIMYTTDPCDVDIVERPANLSVGRYDDQEFRHLPHTWLKMSIMEGKYHQIRKMVSAVHHRCQRLIRLSIEDLEYGDMQPGDVREVAEEELFRLLRIDDWK